LEILPVGRNVAQKLIESHLVKGKMEPGSEIGLSIDQTLCQDATGTMVMLELEAMGCQRVKTELSAQYVDHNLLQTDFKNADDHLFLQSACERFGIWYSPAGNGVSHPVHMERFGIPGKTLLGSDSHTCAAGSMGMLAIGAGGLEVALAMMGEPYYVKMPKIWGVKLTGALQPWVSAKDVILELLRRHDVSGGVGKIIEYYGPGLDCLSAMDRHVIANMGAELGATASVFPSDAAVRIFLESQERGEEWHPLVADDDATYDLHEEIDLSKLEPLIALPSSPGNVVTVREVAGRPVFQAMIGSSANPGMRDFAIAAMMVQGKKVPPQLSFDIIPTSRQILENLIDQRYLQSLVQSGARIHQAGCNGCIGMGQAPATGRISLRTVPRNFPGRSGTEGDQVYLCSPETAAASALTGVITDPRTLDMPYPRYQDPTRLLLDPKMVIAPPVAGKSRPSLVMGPNIQPLPEFSLLPDRLEGPVLLKEGDNISTDEILPAGANVLPFRSNIPEIAKFTFHSVDPTFYSRAMAHGQSTAFIVAGSNYGQGSSREHAVISPRYLGIRAVLAKSFARIHRKNLAVFGIVPLLFIDAADYDQIEQGDKLICENLLEQLNQGKVQVRNVTKNVSIMMQHDLTPREIEILRVGSLVNVFRAKPKA
jgi:aconitate hydratase